MEKQIYDKICVFCGREYKSYSRGQRYCSDTCCEKAQKRKTKINKAKEIRRRRYNETREIQLLLASTYKTAERVAFLYLPNECFCGGDPELEGPLEIHHKNGWPLDNSPENLVRLTKQKHAKLHTLLPKINMVDIIEESIKRGVPLEEVFKEKAGDVDIREITEKFLQDQGKEKELIIED